MNNDPKEQADIDPPPAMVALMAVTSEYFTCTITGANKFNAAHNDACAAWVKERNDLGSALFRCCHLLTESRARFEGDDDEYIYRRDVTIRRGRDALKQCPPGGRILQDGEAVAVDDPEKVIPDDGELKRPRYKYPKQMVGGQIFVAPNMCEWKAVFVQHDLFMLVSNHPIKTGSCCHIEDGTYVRHYKTWLAMFQRQQWGWQTNADGDNAVDPPGQPDPPRPDRRIDVG